MQSVPYASACGSLMYAMVATRPDIAHAVGVVSRFMANPGRLHSDAVKSIMRYLKGTKNKCLCYGEGPFELKGFCDSDMAGDVDTRKSTSGDVFTLAGGAVSWCSRLQKIVALSMTEAEYISATEASKEAIWLARLCSDFCLPDKAPMLGCDSQSAICLAKNAMFHARTKHIDVRYHFIREVLEDGLITLVKKQKTCLNNIFLGIVEVPKVVLKKGKTQFFKTGNPMVYSNAVDRIIARPPPETGDLVLVTDGAIHPIAWGVYNSASMFIVRIMEMEDEVSRQLLKSRIASALDIRMRLGLPTNHTNIYRLVNSEGDRCLRPGSQGAAAAEKRRCSPMSRQRLASTVHKARRQLTARCPVDTFAGSVTCFFYT
ncbi:hypothetical protein L7F22_027607 [Adiantum nelumboides]|nr:hypothetical protein [Adiantum nelumboides]